MIFLSLLLILSAKWRLPLLSPPVLSSLCSGITESFSLHHNYISYNEHVVAAPINVATLILCLKFFGVSTWCVVLKVFNLQVLIFSNRIQFDESLSILCVAFIFSTSLVCIKCKKVFVSEQTSAINAETLWINFLWISNLQMNQCVWFASEYIFASLHKGVNFVSVRCFLCTFLIDFIESKSER